jgi:hypothetical protein
MAIVTVPPTRLDIAVAKTIAVIPSPELSTLRNCLPGELLTSIFSARLQAVGGCLPLQRRCKAARERPHPGDHADCFCATSHPEGGI